MKASTHVVLALAMVAIAVVPASADIYSNGPVNGTLGGYFISGAQAISDSFVVSSAATVTGVDFGAFVGGTDTLLTVDWSIGTAPITSNEGNGTAAVTTGPAINGANDDFFAVPNLALAPGTYYLTLQNAITAQGAVAGWDINNGPSTAYFDENGGPAILLSGGPGTSESFDIQGAGGAVTPEPGYWALLSAAMVGLIWLKLRRAGVRS